ncbi:hypothetical protein IJH74_00255 [Candidatus Saccharibacteria bacterium]|nr:hypothetical protein [Candidatus Saccharibacteria bacterium]
MKFRNPKLFAPIAQKIALVLIAVSVILVGANVFAMFYFDPEKVTQREMEKISKDFYENYFYRNYAADLVGNELKEEFDKLREPGFSRVYLRQLLLYDNGKHADSAKYFNYNGYKCDTNKTYVIFYPDPPYLEKDYHTEYHYDCH